MAFSTALGVEVALGGGVDAGVEDAGEAGVKAFGATFGEGVVCEDWASLLKFTLRPARSCALRTRSAILDEVG
eukprot:10971945-Alexandrium_andersonii.AAC.1